MSSLISNYIILKEHNLLIEHHSGNLDLKSYIDFVTRTSKDPLFSANMNFLIDLSNVVVTSSLEDIYKYNTFTEETFKCIKKRKVAMITNTPNQLVFSTLFKNGNTQKLKEIEIFSTMTAATDWLCSSLNNNEIIDIFNNLKEYSLK